MPPRSSREIEELLKSHGFRLDRHGRHGDLWTSPLLDRPVPVPRGKGPGTIPGGTVRAILREAQINREDALKFWGMA